MMISKYLVGTFDQNTFRHQHLKMDLKRLRKIEAQRFGNLGWKLFRKIPVGIYLLKVNNRITRSRCKICSKLTIKAPERRQWRRSGVVIVSFEHISHFVLVFLLLTLNM